MRYLIILALIVLSIKTFAADVTLMVSLAPLASTEGSMIVTSEMTDGLSEVLNREQIRAVRDDAFNFLAGEAITEKLEEVIKELKDEVTEIKDATDEQVASLLVASAK